MNEPLTPHRTCRRCGESVPLTRFGYMSQHMLGMFSCPGSQSDDWQEDRVEPRRDGMPGNVVELQFGDEA